MGIFLLKSAFFLSTNMHTSVTLLMKLKIYLLNQEGVYQNEERLSFQIHGQEGPHSYRYGYDTGNG